MSQTHAIEGDLTYATVAGLHPQVKGWLQADGSEVVFDFASTGRADSAGLALLVESLELAATAGKQLRFINLPQSLVSLAQINGLDALIATATD